MPLAESVRQAAGIDVAAPEKGARPTLQLLPRYGTRLLNLRQTGGLLQSLWKNLKVRTLVAAAVAVVLGVGAGHAFVGSVYVVAGTSMVPAYPPETPLYGAPISTALERCDVVLLDDGHEDYALKRIIGLPGETVQLWRGRVFINQQMLVEPYLPAHTYTYPTEQARRGAICALGEDEYFVLGDNRLYSADSRAYGSVKRSQIKRRVPPPSDFVCAHFSPYTLPAYGKTSIRPTAQGASGAHARL
jgi:signal peptidase I